MSEDITDKLDRLLDRIEGESRPSKDDVSKILELLSNECPEDKVVVLQAQYMVDNYWHVDRKRIKDNLRFLLNYFNIIRDRRMSIDCRKTLAIKVEGAIAKTLFRSKNSKEILRLLGESE